VTTDLLPGTQPGTPAGAPRRVYLDHAATTPVRPEALEALLAEAAHVGNPSSAHAEGRRARKVLEDAREEVAAALGARGDEVVLVSGGTEADNLALAGLVRARQAADPARRRLVVGAVEHPAVLEPARRLAAAGEVELVVVPVDDIGRLRTDALAAALDAAPGATALVSVMWANNETGTLQPLDEVVALAAAHGVPVHSDAVQAPATQDVDLAASGLAALSVSGHKVGAPVGSGALLVRRGTALAPVQHGGGHERGLRAGTPAAAQARGLAVALTAAAAERPAVAARLRRLRERLLDGVLGGPPASPGAGGAAPEAVLRGTRDPALSLPGTTLLTLPGCDADALLYLLDARGIAVSTGSACAAGALEASHVLTALGATGEDALGALRVSLGRTSTAEDVDALLAALPDVVAAARRARAATAAPPRPAAPGPAAPTRPLLAGAPR